MDHVIVGLVGMFLGLVAGFFMGKKNGWHNGCSQCLDAFASALKTLGEAASAVGEQDPKHGRKLRVAINTLASEYREELKARGIWKTLPRKVSGLSLPDLEDEDEDELMEQIEADAREEELGPDLEDLVAYAEGEHGEGWDEENLEPLEEVEP